MLTWTKELTTAVSKMSGVTNIVIADEMGEFVEGQINSDPESQAALLAYMSEIVSSIADSMSFGRFRNLVLKGDRENLLIYSFQGFLIGIKVDETAFIGEIQKEVSQILNTVSSKK